MPGAPTSSVLVAAARRRLSGRCWRAVEAQHIVSTLKLVDTLDEQQVLERVLDDTKPPVPPECRQLHYLLSTPFRYGAPHPAGSRFRRAGLTAGVFYGSETPATAVGEMAFHRLLFFAESPGTPWPVNASEYTAFMVRFRTTAGLDLTAAPLARLAARWSHLTDYSACQELADAARAASVEVVRYASVRTTGRNLAVLSCRAFTSREPQERQGWRLQFGPQGVGAIGDFPGQRLSFDRAAFAADPRIAGMKWQR
ncbi:MAG TPA: RES family NAD+ phosphorylase [Vicinamibacterales bacterium]|nr:RES family NAD+ phosphorylase [Vicinamibacterales bacterium]